MNYNKETKTLTINYDFNEELTDIPEDTKIIIFKKNNLGSSKFNKKVDNLPKNLTHITFSTNFNQTVNNLPQKLIHLIFGFYFNKKVNNLPKNLTHLTFGALLNKKVDKLPKNLTHLTIESSYQKLVYMPKNLKYLKINWYFQNEIILPKSLKKLSLTCNNILIDNIPEHIEKIYIFFDYYIEAANYKIENLPSTIKEIVIENEEYKKYIKIPFGCILTIKKIE